MDYFESMPSDVRETLVTAIETAVRIYPHVEPEEEREGAFLCVTDLNGRTMLHQRVGRVSRETLDDVHEFKVTRYERLSLEKARRLAARTIDGHRTSFESRFPEAAQWGRCRARRPVHRFDLGSAGGRRRVAGAHRLRRGRVTHAGAGTRTRRHQSRRHVRVVRRRVPGPPGFDSGRCGRSEARSLRRQSEPEAPVPARRGRARHALILRPRPMAGGPSRIAAGAFFSYNHSKYAQALSASVRSSG